MHNFIKVRECLSPRVVGNYKINPLPPCSESVGKKQLPHIHIYPDKGGLYVALTVSVENPCVGIRIAQAFQIKPLAVVFLHIAVDFFSRLQVFLNSPPPSWISINPSGDYDLIHLLQQHLSFFLL